MNINNFNIRLEFELLRCAPKEYQTKWLKLKNQLEWCDITTEDRDNLLNSVINYCKIETNKNLPILKRVEGGLGGDSNIDNKQLRFYHDLTTLNNKFKWPNSSKLSNTIIIDIFNSNNNDEIWTLEELSDLVDSFSKTFSDYMEEEDCIEGKITLTNK